MLCWLRIRLQLVIKCTDLGSILGPDDFFNSSCSDSIFAKIIRFRLRPWVRTIDRSGSSSRRTGAYTGSACGGGSTSMVFDTQIETLNHGTHFECDSCSCLIYLVTYVHAIKKDNPQPLFRDPNFVVLRPLSREHVIFIQTWIKILRSLFKSTLGSGHLNPRGARVSDHLS